MLAIVICHMLQAYDNRWAFVFNVGVQIFLALSGYLYGKKIISNWRQWTLGRIRRVYVPMLLFLIVVLPLYLSFHREVFSWRAYALNYLNLQGIPFVFGGDMVPGIRHLWFISAIMFAYFSTPILQWASNYSDWLFPFFLICIGILYFIVPGPIVFFASWIFIYLICYMYAHLKNIKIYTIGLLLLELLLVVLVAFKFEVILYYFHPLNRVFHDVSGIFIVIIGIKLLSQLKLLSIPKIVDLFDKYSFHVFLVHYFFIVGPFSLAHITTYVFINIFIIAATTFVAVYLFVKFYEIANRLFFNRMLKVN